MRSRINALRHVPGWLGRGSRSAIIDRFHPCQVRANILFILAHESLVTPLAEYLGFRKITAFTGRKCLRLIKGFQGQRERRKFIEAGQPYFPPDYTSGQPGRSKGTPSDRTRLLAGFKPA
jgi:hypothetical protein